MNTPHPTVEQIRTAAYAAIAKIAAASAAAENVLSMAETLERATPRNDADAALIAAIRADAESLTAVRIYNFDEQAIDLLASIRAYFCAAN